MYICVHLDLDGGKGENGYQVIGGVSERNLSSFCSQLCFPEVEFCNSEELSLIKSSPLPAQLPQAGEELTPLDSLTP